MNPAIAPDSPPLWSFAPFILLLLAIAVLPLLGRLAHFWEKNRNKLLVALVLGGVTLLYYALGRGPEAAGKAIEQAVLADYFPFMVLLFSLYTIAGGIHLDGDLKATPLVNSLFLLSGTLLASLIGTTGASMLLIRPLLKTNQERRKKVHTVIFFIFLVSNIGGCLTPLGDPPLFLGYLRGVPFWWTLQLALPCLFMVGCLIALYYFWDSRAYGEEAESDRAVDALEVKPLRLLGGTNLLWLLGVVAAVALIDPSRPLPGLGWKPFPYLRELILLGLTALSWLTTAGNRDIRARNEFTFGAIIEVAALFLGIFICMQPPIEYLELNGAHLGLTSPLSFFWSSGILSSFLDNAPTYVVFFETARGLGAAPGGQLPALPAEFFLRAISLGSVFMGANTYIGNGPNFMVKTIAEKSGVRMPSFFGYMAYSVTILIPLFAALSAIFFR